MQHLMQQRTSQTSTAPISSKRHSHWLKNLRTATAGLGLSLAVALTTAVPSTAVPVQKLLNPQQEGSGWVTDMADMLSPTEEAQLNQLITELEATKGHEIAVVTVSDTAPAATPKAFTTELFNLWGIGKKGEDNGVLFLVSKGDRRTEIEVGYGLEATLPDAKVGEILRSRVTPEFKQGNFGVGILNGTEAIVTVLNGDTLTDSITTSAQAQSTQVQTNNTRKPNNNGESADNVVFILMMLGLGGVALIGVATGGGSSSSNSTYNNNSSNFDSGGGYSGGGGSNYSGGSDFGGGSSGGGGGGDSW